MRLLEERIAILDKKVAGEVPATRDRSPSLDEEMRKKVEAKTQDILENPRKYEDRWKRRVLERIAYREVLEEEKAAKAAAEKASD